MYSRLTFRKLPAAIGKTGLGWLLQVNKVLASQNCSSAVPQRAVCGFFVYLHTHFLPFVWSRT